MSNHEPSVAPDDTPTRLHQVRETTKMMDKDVRLRQMGLDPPGGDHQQHCDCNICFLWAEVSRLREALDDWRKRFGLQTTNGWQSAAQAETAHQEAWTAERKRAEADLTRLQQEIKDKDYRIAELEFKADKAAW